MFVSCRVGKDAEDRMTRGTTFGRSSRRLTCEDEKKKKKESQSLLSVHVTHLVLFLVRNIVVSLSTDTDALLYRCQ